MQRIPHTKTLLPDVRIPFLVHKGLMYMVYGLKTFFDVYVLKAKEGTITNALRNLEKK